MRFLSTLLLLGGYMLLYAAVAKGGRFATEPWEGLFHDAYTGQTTTTPPAAPGSAPPPSPAPQSGATPRGIPKTNIGAQIRHGHR